MRYITFVGITLFAVGIMAFLGTFSVRYAQEVVTFDDPMFTYDPGEWRNASEPMACSGGNWQEGKVFNETSGWFTYPRYGYPLRSKLVVGLNDTAQVEIFLRNRTDKPYSLKGKSPEKWFAPRVFRMEDFMSTGIPWRDSTDLGYRIRGWRLGQQQKMEPQDTIPAWFNGTWSMVMDVWNLPEGHYSLCIDTTKDVPSDFQGFGGGDNYEYYKPRDLADTVNAYEGCFWRMIKDSNYIAAKTWIDKIMAANPTSVPGWWLKATYYYYVKDTVETKKSYDKAIQYWQTSSDPAMPDSTERVLLDTEKNYVEWCGQRLKWERSFYAP